MTLEALVILLSACLWLHTLARIQQDARIKALEKRVKELEQWGAEAQP